MPLFETCIFRRYERPKHPTPLFALKLNPKMLEILKEMGQELLTQLAWWKVFAALGGSMLMTAIAFGVLLWAEHRQTKS